MKKDPLPGRGVPALACALLAVLACSPRNDDARKAERISRPLISDQAHGGKTGFWFLPPLVPEPQLEGVFDRSLSPTVQIDELDSLGAVKRPVAVFTKTSGPGKERVQIKGNHYQVNFRTGSFGLNPALVYRIRVLVAGRELGLRDVQPRSPGRDKGDNDEDEDDADEDDGEDDDGDDRDAGPPAAAAVYSFKLGRTLPIKFFVNACGPVFCTALTQCHDVGLCAPSTGVCSEPAKPNGTTCDDGNSATDPDTCQAGSCIGGNPLTPTTTCVTRFTPTQWAALFGYINTSASEISIPEGPLNAVTPSVAGISPPTAFLPGPHDGVLQVPFDGTVASWTLGTRTTSASASTRRCTEEDYPPSPDPFPPGVVDPDNAGPPSDEVLARQVPSVIDESELVRIPVPLGTASLPEPTQAVAAQALATPPPAPAPFTVRLTGLSFGFDDDYVAFPPNLTPFDVDAEVSIDGGPATKFDLFTCPAGVVGCSVPTVLALADTLEGLVPSDQRFVNVRIVIIERDAFPFGFDDELLAVDLRVDNQTGQWTGTTTSPNSCFRGPSFGSFGSFGAFGAWGICWEITTSARPVLDYGTEFCFAWNAQFIDGGFGEDIANSGDLQALPANHALVRWGITAVPTVGFGFEGFLPLGICPQGVSANDLATPAFGSHTVAEFALQSRFRSGLVEWRVMSKLQQDGTIGADPNIWELGTRIEKRNGSIAGWERRGGWLVPPRTIRLVHNTHGPVTYVSAMVSQVLRTPDNGLRTDRPGLIQIRADEGCPPIPKSACASGQTIFIPPGPSQRTQESRWKFLVTHEIGHIVQAGAMGIPSGSAAILTGTPALCACKHVTVSNKIHCLGSLHQSAFVQGEAFAHFFASKIWNDADESECRFNYYKEYLNRDLVPGTQKCKEPTPPDEPIPAGLFCSFPPVPRTCKQPVQWRNSNCIVPEPGRSELPGFGVQFDWMGFLWNLHTSTVNGFSMDKICRVYRRACGRLTADADCSANDRGDPKWDTLRASAANLFGMASEETLYFEQTGRVFGVDRNVP